MYISFRLPRFFHIGRIRRRAPRRAAPAHVSPARNATPVRTAAGRPSGGRPAHAAPAPCRTAAAPSPDKRFLSRLRWGMGCLALTALLICIGFSVFDAPPVGCRGEDLAPLSAATAAVGEAPADTGKTAYLTFDDGPSENTERILDILKEAGVPATFFVIAAENNEEHLPLLERTLAEGHCIGLHSCTHEYREIYASAEAFWQDIDALKQKLEPYCGSSFAVLRFPGGSSNTVSHKYGGSGLMEELIPQAKERGYAVVDWNVTAEDSVGGTPSANTIASRVIRGCKDKNQAIILMHDSSTNAATAEALPVILGWMQENNYTFDTVDHLPQS